MKTLFTIGSDTKECDTLLIELGLDHCCYAFLNRSARKFGKISYLTQDEFADAASIKSLIDELQPERMEQVIICSAYVQALLIPQKYFSPDCFLPALVYEQQARNQFTDRIPEWQMVTSYSIPALMHDMIISRIASPVFFHAYTPALKIYNGFTASDQVDLYFSTRFFRVLVKKDQHVHLAQTYAYKTPLDVVYYLLKIFNELKLDQNAAFLVISGLIDSDSAMYQELHHYFLNLHFAQSPVYTVPDNEHPAYYFNSMYNLAACVS